LEPWYSDPDKLGWIAVLGAWLGYFLSGKTMLTKVHDQVVAHMRADFTKREEQLRRDFDQRLAVERERWAEWKELAKVGSYAAKDLASAALKGKINETT
jgi:hypothetical protein